MPGAVETGFRPSRRTPLASFSPQRESRAPMRQHGHGRRTPRVILAAAGIQSPCNAPTRSWPPQTPLAAILAAAGIQPPVGIHTMRQHGPGRTEPRSRHSRRGGNPEPLQCANTVLAATNPALAILAAAGIQSSYNAPTRSWPPRTRSRQCRCSGSIVDSVTEMPASRSWPPGRNGGVGRFSRGGRLDT